MPELVYNKVYVLKCEVWEVRDMIVLRYTIAVVACNDVVQLGVVDSSDLVIIQVPSCQAHSKGVYNVIEETCHFRPYNKLEINLLMA